MEVRVSVTQKPPLGQRGQNGLQELGQAAAFAHKQEGLSCREAR